MFMDAPNESLGFNVEKQMYYTVKQTELNTLFAELNAAKKIFLNYPESVTKEENRLLDNIQTLLGIGINNAARIG